MAKNPQQAQQKDTSNVEPNKVAQEQGQATSPTGPKVGVELNGRKDPREIVQDGMSKSKAIRALAAAGYTNAEIVKISRMPEMKILQYNDGREIRYQHVRNVMSQPIKDTA